MVSEAPARDTMQVKDVSTCPPIGSRTGVTRDSAMNARFHDLFPADRALIDSHSPGPICDRAY